ncbi:hypothetical protein GCM10009744_46980 [Kribbella alba]|uniref:Uncharacterized protein n=1 Tax=Kribbella alba TaxID=190197 RepID=A0ABN2FJK1_9ACTN
MCSPRRLLDARVVFEVPGVYSPAGSGYEMLIARLIGGAGLFERKLVLGSCWACGPVRAVPAPTVPRRTPTRGSLSRGEDD